MRIGMAMMGRATMVNMGKGTTEENPTRRLHLIIKSETLLKIPVPYVLFDSFLLFAGIPPARKMRRFIEEKRYPILAVSPLCHPTRGCDAHSTGNACYDSQRFDYS